MSDYSAPRSSGIPAPLGTDAGFFSWNPDALGAQLLAARAAQGDWHEAPSCLHARDLRRVGTALVKACDSEELLEVPREALALANCAWGKQLCCAADARWAPCGCPFWALSERRAVVLAICRALQSGAFALPEGASMEEVDRACAEIGLALRLVDCNSQGQPKRRKIVASHVKTRAQDWKAGIRELAIDACLTNESARANVWRSDPLCPTMDVLLWAPVAQESPLAPLCELVYSTDGAMFTDQVARSVTGKFQAFVSKTLLATQSLKFCYVAAVYLCLDVLDKQSLLEPELTPTALVEVLAKHGPCAAQHVIRPLLEHSALDNILAPLRAFFSRLKAAQGAPRGCDHTQLRQNIAKAAGANRQARSMDVLAAAKKDPDWFELAEGQFVLPSWWWTSSLNPKGVPRLGRPSVKDTCKNLYEKIGSWMRQAATVQTGSVSAEVMDRLLYDPEPTAVANMLILVLAQAVAVNITTCVNTFKNSQMSVNYFCEQVGTASGMHVELKNCQVQSAPKQWSAGPRMQSIKRDCYGFYLPLWEPRENEAITYLRCSVAFTLNPEASESEETKEAGQAQGADDADGATGAPRGEEATAQGTEGGAR